VGERRPATRAGDEGRAEQTLVARAATAALTPRIESRELPAETSLVRISFSAVAANVLSDNAVAYANAAQTIPITQGN